jgi:thiol-disulfide isomerase/thioredoxin
MVKIVKFSMDQYPQAYEHMKNIKAIVLVYHPQCGHCVQLRPLWEEMKKKVPSETNIVEIDGTKLSEITDKTNTLRQIEGFPSIYESNHLNKKNFDKPRTIDNLLHFVKQSIKEKPKISLKKLKPMSLSSKNRLNGIRTTMKLKRMNRKKNRKKSYKK